MGATALNIAQSFANQPLLSSASADNLYIADRPYVLSLPSDSTGTLTARVTP